MRRLLEGDGSPEGPPPPMREALNGSVGENRLPRFPMSLWRRRRSWLRLYADSPFSFCLDSWGKNMYVLSCNYYIKPEVVLPEWLCSLPP